MLQNIRLVVLVLLCLGTAALSALAQTAPQHGRLLVTVADPSGGIIPDATVTLVGVEPATKAMTFPPAKTSDKGVATFDGLMLDRYSITAEFPAFELGLLRDIKVNRGDNKHVVVLALKGRTESVTVGPDGQATGADRASKAFGLTVTDEQIAALSDDPAEMQRQLQDLAGPDAIVRVDSFEGQQLPPKAQIKSIHVTRDQFAAETEQPGSTFVDVITQPGVGPIRGGFNTSYRNGDMRAQSPFVNGQPAEQFRGYGANIGGALVKQKSNFSLSINGENLYTTPNLYATTVSGGTQAEFLNLRQPLHYLYVNGLLDYALTKDQTLRFGYTQGHYNQSNLGVGAYDYSEHAYSSDQAVHQFRALEAGPIGRRVFINTRLTTTWVDYGNHSAVEAPTIVVQDAFTTGGAQQAGETRGRTVQLASDLDYVRGIHSWRTGVILYANWYHSDARSNYLGTYTFSSIAAFDQGTPAQYLREAGDPSIDYFNAHGGAYIQDDIRVRKGLTLSPGVRYSLQSHVHDYAAVEPRFGMTWAPWPSGNTTLRASGGIFHGWLQESVLQRTLQFDGSHQQELVIVNPSYPDPGLTGYIPPTNKYLLGDFHLQQNVRYSAGIDRKFSSRFNVNVLFNYFHQRQQPRGRNLNPLVDGRRPDPAFANEIEVVTDGQIIRHELYINFGLNLASGPAAGGARFNWRRLTLNGAYSFIRATRNTGTSFATPFDVPASGTLDTEWGNGPADNPYRVFLSLNSTQLKNLAVSVSANASDGSVYTLFTGYDDNQDGILNDRPAGVGTNTLRAARQFMLNTRLTYSLPMPGQHVSPAPGPGGPPRYRASVYAAITNLTNHLNYVGFSGVMTSKNFLRPTGVINPRRVDVGLNINF